ncbi:MAG: ABC transporter permease, partial [Yoonia sp.]
MESLNWTGATGALLNPIWTITLACLALAIVLQIIMSFFVPAQTMQSNADGTLAARGGYLGGMENVTKVAFAILVVISLIYVIAGVLLPYGTGGIIGAMFKRFLPVWITQIITFAVSIYFKRSLGLYGKLFDSTVGMIGFALVMFWVFTAIFSGLFEMLITHDPLAQVSGMKNKVPGIPVPATAEATWPHYLLGGDNLARDVFSRVVKGSVIVIAIAPLATMFAFMVGITLGLPAGYYGGRLDTILSFLANLILAFPVILLFYLLVTPEIVATG